MASPPILKIALPTPLRRCFDYLPPSTNQSGPYLPGSRIRVPFGNRDMVGILVQVVDHSDVPRNKLKPANKIIDEQPIIPAHILRLYEWCANYYQHPLGDVLATALPTLLRKGETNLRQTEIVYLATELGRAQAQDQLSRAPKQAEVMALALEHPKGFGEHAIQTLGLSGSPLKALLDKGFLVRQSIQITPQRRSATILAEAPLTLNTHQRQAVDAVTQSLAAFSCFLIEGVTGSGKTEVYLQVIEQVLKKGGSALVLVPEIGLTPQTVSRFKRRFNVPITLLHSGLSDQQRAHDWLYTAQEEAGIIIGTRSSVFTPIRHLGIIIVDEEHDLSFKQQDGLRYSARDIAVMRAHQENIPILLGTATPSLESLYNVQSNRYHRLQLPERAGNAALPSFELIDVRSRPLQDGYSQPLISAISEQLAQGNQVLIFLNRRGFSPIMMCHECGWIANCKRCDARLTLHLNPYQLRCHHCSAQKKVPPSCPDCGHTQLSPLGVGTERSEQAISELFPKTEIIRIDRDTTRAKSAMQNLVAIIKEGKPCILIGTQMLAKGHHFPNVTLVAILEADAGFFSSDFRGLERMGQLITQVAGRAGRAKKSGKVLIQTHHADHPLLNQLITRGYSAFAQQLLADREQTNLPPYSHAALIRAEAVKEQAPFEFLTQVQKLAQQLSNTYQLKNIELFGPIPAIMYKRSGRYRAQLMLICSDRKSLHQLLTPLCLQLESLGGSGKVRWSVDVDPQESI